MAENLSTPPPPPPPGKKPVPPPPPRQGGSPATPPSAPISSLPASAPAPKGPIATSPSVPGAAPRPAAGGPMPMPGMGPSPFEQRIQEMEKKFQEQDNDKKSLEVQLDEISKQLKDEHEKVLMQSLRAKEEEALSSRVEQQIREMQDKLRREKHEQEILESRSKAENQLKDIERRLVEERESWMNALKNQMKERELMEQDVEKNLTRRLREAEEHFAEEKNQWLTESRVKDDEMAQLKRQLQLNAEEHQEVLEEKEETLEQLRETSTEQRRTYEREMQAELRAFQGQMDVQARDFSAAKAQLALVQSQLQQADALRQEERTRGHAELKRQEEDLKREYSRREQERTQYWESMMTQIRNERDSIRNTLMTREEEISRLQAEVLEERRALESDRARWKGEAEHIRLSAREEALRNIPEAVEQQMAQERKHHLATMQQLKLQLQESLESSKGLVSKVSMLTQERDRIQADLNDEQDMRESQTKKFLQQIAEVQLRESALREELQGKQQELQAFADYESIRAEKNELLLYKNQADKDLEDMRREVKAMSLTLGEWKNTVAQLQQERNARDIEWLEKEKLWEKTKAEWEKTAAELEKAREAAIARAETALQQAPTQITVPAEASPEATKALTAIRQQMQEMQTLLSWLKPLKKQSPFNQAA